MAITNRKLFPTLTSSNATIYCFDLCDPACPYYDCPDFYFPQPPPPPPPPPPSSTTVSPSLITSLALLSGFFILLGYYLIIVKSCFCRRSRSSPAHAPPSMEDGNEEFVDENRVDHPIWFITTEGLQQSIINAIAACKYRKGEGLIEGSECSVCLNDFREGETLRLLPKCSHAFHLRCIDTWLRSHTNCPLCRANIVAPVGAEPELIERNGEYSGEDSGPDEDLHRNSGHGNREETEELQGEVASKDHPTRGELQMPEEIELKSGSGSLSICSSSSRTSSPEHQIYVGVQKSSARTAALKQDGTLEVVAAAHCSLIGQGPAPMERSRSCGSGFTLSRHSRTTSSILPY